MFIQEINEELTPPEEAQAPDIFAGRDPNDLSGLGFTIQRGQAVLPDEYEDWG